MQKRCKPGYVGTVSMPCRSVIYLSRGVAAGLQQSTPRQRTSNPCSAGILDLATHRMYAKECLQTSRWALTPPFHPYLLRGGHSLLRYYTLTDIKSLACVALCVARTFLPRLAAAAIERVCTVQIYAFFLIPPRCGRKPGRAQARRFLYRDCSGFMSFTRSCVLTVPR